MKKIVSKANVNRLFQGVYDGILKQEQRPSAVRGPQKKADLKRLIKTSFRLIDVPWVPNFIENPIKDVIVDALIDFLHKVMEESGLLKREGECQ